MVASFKFVWLCDACSGASGGSDIVGSQSNQWNTGEQLAALAPK
jgi:hypothetical protein